MKVEWPQFKKCCFCIPLRYGLLVWGYLKMLASLLNLLVIAVLITKCSDRACDTIGLRAVFSVIIILWAVDVGFNVAFIVGAHKKNIKLLRVYYFYLMVGVVIISLLYLAYLLLSLIEMRQMSRMYGSSRMSSYFTNLAIEMALGIVNVALQSYLLLLIRSEVLKLRASCKFQFVNNASDAECSLRIQKDVEAIA